MIVNLKLNQRRILYKYFQVLNLIQDDVTKHLTESEMELLIEFVLLPDKFKYARFSSPAKNRVIVTYAELYNKKLSKINLNNKLYMLLEKGYLRRDTDKIIYIQDFIMRAINSILGKPTYDITLKFQLDAN